MVFTLHNSPFSLHIYLIPRRKQARFFRLSIKCGKLPLLIVQRYIANEKTKFALIFMSFRLFASYNFVSDVVIVVAVFLAAYGVVVKFV